ncbi:MAG: mannonate dehydratase [Ignavibacteriales bacterium]|nr:mannonate dehydratase [Ignavibacteriales bacterium]
MTLEPTWRWFGPTDPITLKEVKQTGATGIVTALHHIPIGEVWTTDEIMKRKNQVESEGLRWSVAESLPLHEAIKKRKGSYGQLIENYKASLRNLGHCGIDTVCYNFMPVLDWSRTALDVEFKDGSITTKFEAKAFAAFDIFILKRPDAARHYDDQQYRLAKEYYEGLDESLREKLLQTVLLGFPGSKEAYTLEQFKLALTEYDDVGDKGLRENLYAFLREIIPVAEESGVFMALHPDDPPWPLLGLPRVVSNKQDVEQLLAVMDSPSNGITLCTGSLGAGIQNDLVEMAERFAKRVNFIHLRNVTRNEAGDFLEDNHLDGDVDMYGVMKALILEQRNRADNGRRDRRMPMRPDHGHLMLADQHRSNIYPGYSLFGRMRGLAELRGMELGIRRSLGL